MFCSLARSSRPASRSSSSSSSSSSGGGAGGDKSPAELRVTLAIAAIPRVASLEIEMTRLRQEQATRKQQVVQQQAAHAQELAQQQAAHESQVALLRMTVEALTAYIYSLL